MTDLAQFSSDTTAMEIIGLAAGVLAGLAAGYLVGLVHFRSLRVVVNRLIDGHVSAAAFQLLRFAGVGLVLYGLVQIGGRVLVAAAIGILLARSRVIAGYGAGQ